MCPAAAVCRSLGRDSCSLWAFMRLSNDFTAFNHQLPFDLVFGVCAARPDAAAEGCAAAAACNAAPAALVSSLFGLKPIFTPCRVPLILGSSKCPSALRFASSCCPSLQIFEAFCAATSSMSTSKSTPPEPSQDACKQRDSPHKQNKCIDKWMHACMHARGHACSMHALQEESCMYT